MEKLLKLAMQSADAAEIYCVRTRSLPVMFRERQLDRILAKDITEVSLRVIKDGRIGAACGTDLEHLDRLVNEAVRASASGATAQFTFPSEKSQPREIYDPQVAEINQTELADLCNSIVERLKSIDSEIPSLLSWLAEVREVTILNSSGKNETYKMTLYGGRLTGIFKGSKEGVSKEMFSCRYFDFPMEKIEELAREYELSKTICEVSTKHMPVIFRGSTTWTLMYRLMVGAGGNAFVKKTSPLVDKVGLQVMSPLITIVDDPTIPYAPGSVPFDDEGVPTCKKSIIERGVFRNFIFDLDTGGRSGMTSSGNGFKKSMWTTGIEIPPNPRFTNLVIEKGDLSYNVLLSSLDEGIVVHDVVGFHSGNMLQGQFSMSVGVGFYVKNGTPRGRAVNTMVAGNIYENFMKIGGLSNTQDPNPFGFSPDILFEDMSVSGKA